MRESWWVCHLWICSSKLIFGPASSSLWTENLKPTDSWARVWRKSKKIEREGERERAYKTHVTSERGGQLKRDERGQKDRNKMPLYIKAHIMFKVSSNRQ